MTLALYNTLTQQKEVFQPLKPGQVSMYVCGPTVYDYAHIGNARPMVVFDILYRLLQREYTVTYVRNITDVDDKINNAALESGVPIATITERTTKIFHDDMASLNILPPTFEPRATHHIAEMIAFIQKLVEQGYAYESHQHVLFEVSKLPTYGRLSRRKREDMLAGARVEVAPYKRDPGDFVLWKPSDEVTPGWESPWGFGRPGWHIECSAMSQRHLGITFDIHGGGQDLIFPHHENEIAQSTAANGRDTFARYWMHNGMLTVEGQKMSKSLGNFITIRDALKRNQGETLRYLLLSTHYRQALDWTKSTLYQAKQALDRFYTALRPFNLRELPTGEIDPRVLSALQDDLNTSLAFSHLHDLVSTLNKTQNDNERQHIAATLQASGQFLGFFHHDPEAWFKAHPSVTDAEKNKRMPYLTLIAGSNGSGKTTFADHLRSSLPTGNFINADIIAAEDLPLKGRKSEIEAGRETLRRIKKLSEQKLGFMLETTLSGKGYAVLIERLKKEGYQIHLSFLWVSAVDLAIERVRERIKDGGHPIPEADIKRRYDLTTHQF